MDMSMQVGNPYQGGVKFFEKKLNERARELKLDGKVEPVQPADGVGAVTWVLRADGQLTELGWSVEEAEMTLRRLAGQANL